MSVPAVPHTFVAIWGFGLMAIIHFLDATFEYLARTPQYDMEVFQNHRFLWLSSRREWTATQRPSMWHTLFLLLPGILCAGLYLSLVSVWVTISPNWEIFVIFLLTLGAWFAVCRLYNDFHSQVYIALAAGFCALMLFRLVLVDDWVAQGYGFDTTSAVFTLILGLAAAIYFGFYFAKFPPSSRILAVRKLTRANIVQIVMVSIWIVVLFVILFPKSLFDQLQGLAP